MKIRIRLVTLTLIGTRKNYTVKFRNGFNYISGHTSTGKTSILEMIDYALGSKGHKSYIEIGSTCSQVELVLFIGSENIDCGVNYSILKRQLLLKLGMKKNKSFFSIIDWK